MRGVSGALSLLHFSALYGSALHRMGRMKHSPPLPSTNLFIGRTRRLNPQPTEFTNPTASWWSTVGLIITNELPIILYTWNINLSHLQPTLNPKWELAGGDKTQDATVNPSDRLKCCSNFSDHCAVYVRHSRPRWKQSSLAKITVDLRSLKLSVINKRNQHLFLVHGAYLALADTPETLL